MHTAPDSGNPISDQKPGLLIGYARVSTDRQDAGTQKALLEQHGCHNVLIDIISGQRQHRPALDELLKDLRPGDRVIVTRLDRLGRNLKDLIQITEAIQTRGADLHSLNENIDTSTAGGKLMFHVMGAIAEFERNLIAERTRSRLRYLQQKGVKLGNPQLRSDDPDIRRNARSAISRGRRGPHSHPGHTLTHMPVIQQMRLRGRNWPSICQELKKRGYVISPTTLRQDLAYLVTQGHADHSLLAPILHGRPKTYPPEAIACATELLRDRKRISCEMLHDALKARDIPPPGSSVSWDIARLAYLIRIARRQMKMPDTGHMAKLAIIPQ